MAGGRTKGTWTPGNGGPGRPKGQKSIANILFDQMVDKYKDELENGTIVSPMSFWMDILQDSTKPEAARDKAAAQLAKYFHQALPVEIEQTVIDAPPVFKIIFENDNEDKVSTED